MAKLYVDGGLSPSADLLSKVEIFIDDFEPYESQKKIPLCLYYDAKSGAYYVICHLSGAKIVQNADLEATLDPNDDDEIYKLNRDITEDQSAYRMMESDALEMRSFEDVVIEYDTTYREDKPLKVYGGQHRVRAIKAALKKGISVVHGARVYFDLSRDQKVEIATVNNTSIAVPNDLLDRMREQLAGSELRNWCQRVGLLPAGEDFADRKDPETPTVRVARTLLVNYHLGRSATVNSFHQPIICRSGGMDPDYEALREQLDWDDSALVEMGHEFARLHKVQREIVTSRDKDRVAEYARKALSLSVVASWGYATGFFQRNHEWLRNHFALTDTGTDSKDPLNAKALSEARHKGTDPDTYRGLGTRTGSGELGRMFELFFMQATEATKRGISKKLANLAIEQYEVKKAIHNLEKQKGKI